MAVAVEALRRVEQVLQVLSIRLETLLQMGVETEGEVGEAEVGAFCLEAQVSRVEAAEEWVDLGSEHD